MKCYTEICCCQSQVDVRLILPRLDYLADCIDDLATKVDSLENKTSQLMEKKALGEEGAFQVC